MLELAAHQGWGPAARLLGGVYQLGLHGIERDARAASYWYKRSSAADSEMKRRYYGPTNGGAVVLKFPRGQCLAELPKGHGIVLW
jgi:TPR repeat protein